MRWCVFVIVCWLNHNIKSQENAGEIDNELVISKAVFKDENDKLEVVRNKNLPNFLIYYTKESKTTGGGAIYRYDDVLSKFVAVKFGTTKPVSSLFTATSTKDMLFCVSYFHKLGFTINQDFEINQLSEVDIEPNKRYIMHPGNSDEGMKCTAEDKTIFLHLNLLTMIMHKSAFIDMIENIEYHTISRRCLVNYFKISNLYLFCSRRISICWILTHFIDRKSINLSNNIYKIETCTKIK
ncbi:hypothetical protein RF11_07946 [Thelohanellus kitauei]|uniref:Uncharacterized protein n=1 Tax=Thelohanellus kitauei TaxID=669202 RepID=A0A0C2MW46_THEKT|nr:hypothetical protein RF11_07946 [Thelohanellus kitauei]